MTDQELVVTALREVGSIIADHLENDMTGPADTLLSWWPCWIRKNWPTQ